MIESIILGILQGIFEWLPISSEGILAITSYLLKEPHPIDISLFLHFGTLLAVLIYFKKEWKEILTFKDKKLLSFLTISTFFSLIFGFLIYQWLKTISLFGSYLLLIVGIGLLLSGFFSEKREKFNFNLNFFHSAVICGILQGFSVIPGFSRSGSTIFGLSLGIKNPTEILKISYMMSVPVVILANLYLVFKNPILISPKSVISLVFSFLVGILVLDYLMKISQRINFSKFCFLFGSLCILGSILLKFL